jgi:hypothetical protein
LGDANYAYAGVKRSYRYSIVTEYRSYGGEGIAGNRA